MEESPIIDSPPENRSNTVFILLSIAAAVFAVLAIIVALRAKSSVEQIETKGDNTAQIAEQVRVAVENQTAAALREVANGKSEIAALQNKALLNENDLRSLRAASSAEITRLTQRIAALESRPVVRPQTPPTTSDSTRPGVPTADRPGTGGTVVRPGPVAEGGAVAGSIYIVKKGDTLTSIANKLNVNFDDLRVHNPTHANNPTKLKVGDKIKVPPRRAVAQPPVVGVRSSGTSAQPPARSGSTAGSATRPAQPGTR